MAGAKWTTAEAAALARGEQPSGRTARACSEKRRRLHLAARRAAARQTSYSKYDLSERLGVSHNKIVYWRGKGWLRGERENGHSGGEWRYSRDAVRRFLVRHRAKLDTARIDADWLLDVLAGSERQEAG